MFRQTELSTLHRRFEVQKLRLQKMALLLFAKKSLLHTSHGLNIRKWLNGIFQLVESYVHHNGRILSIGRTKIDLKTHKLNR